ncbi:type II toxin-antitoxin system RelE/ParE family toxin [Flavobacterium denitrificans]|uniref:type II toxin-antitoxin system RelE/ParE family toxin n=1 Tax=Flavobacterium denitrificans TaxID=281361 RepID=UPI000411F7B6|nr:type II toxin-antitoxin system RelE/ParE family toxin [Flavobacterium denitrificans]
MDKKFDVIFLKEVFDFLKELKPKHSEKIIYNIRRSQTKNDPELFKKLNNEIWEFRTLYQGNHYQLLAFWDKTNAQNTLVISTNGFTKKQSKVPEKEITKAQKLRLEYFKDKDSILKI